MKEIRITHDRLVECQERMCDDFCYWVIASSSEESLQEHCYDCPLCNILNDEFWEKGDEDE